MIRRTVKIQLVAFILISCIGIVYTGLDYVRLSPFNPPYTIVVDFRDSGGIFTNAQVLERGVPVGRVSELTLIPGGVAVHVSIDRKFKIPRNSDAIVADLSAVGEQYVDIRPQTAGPPYFANGDVLPVQRTQIPISDATLLLDLDNLVNSIDRPHLAIMIDELGKAFANTGPDLRRLIQQGDALTQAAQLNLPQTIKLIDDGKTVLDTQRATSGDLQTFAANLASFSQQLVTSDPALRGVLDNGVVSAQQLQGLLQDNQTELPVLLDNLVTLSGIQEARIPGLKTILVLYPPNVANGFFTAASGYAHFGLVTTSAPTACTSGYGSTTQHPNTPAGWGKPANLNTYCTAPNQAPTGASDVRGAALAPRPPGDTTAGPPPGGYPQLAPGAVTPGTLAAEALSLGAVAPVTASTADGPRTLVPYDPLSGLLQAPNGRTYLLGDTGGEQSYLGSQSWEWLLLAPAYG